MSKTGKSVQKQKQINGYQGLGCNGKKWRVTDNGYKILFSDHKTALKLTVAKVAELCEYTKSHWTVYFLNSFHLMFLFNYN